MATSEKIAVVTPRQPLTVSLQNPKIKDSIHQALMDSAREKTFVSSLIAASVANREITECNANSVISVALLGESLNLCPSPQLGYYYFVPFLETVKRNGKAITDANGNIVKEKKAQFILGYKGYIQLALRSGYYRNITVLAIKDGELKRWNPLTEEMEVSLIEDEDIREQTPTIGYYASFSYLNGFRKAIYWTRSKMERHALRYSKGYAAKKGYTFWEKEFDSMAFKTMLRQLISKWGIMSPEMQRAYEADADIVQDDEGNNFFSGEEQGQEEPETPIGQESQLEDSTPAEPSADEHQIGFDDL